MSKHHVIKSASILSTNKLSSTEIYSILMSNIFNEPASNIYFEILFENITIDWSEIYLLPLLATIDATLRSCQYKSLNNVLFLNKILYNFGITKILLFAHFVRLLKKLPYISFMTAFILNLFGKNY